jgi:hypothetical protein
MTKLFRRERITRATATLATLGALLGGVVAWAAPTATGTRAAVSASAGHPAPLAAGPLNQVTGESTYSGFPDTVALPDGDLLTAYRSGSGHASADGRVRLRKSADGDVWTEWIELATPAGYAYGPSGIAAETAEQGGRVYLTVTRYTSTGPNSGTDFRPYMTRSNDGGHTWTDLSKLPEPVPGWTYPSAVIVTTDGSVIVSSYVKDLATGRWNARYWRSTDRGDTWAPFGTLSHASRNFQEPQLVQLDNGQILTALRSDAAGDSYDYIYTAIADPATGTWTTPRATVIHATGNPQLAKLPTGHIALTYRGYGQLSESTTPNAYPTRIAMLHADGSLAYRGNIDILAGEQRRYLYGNIVPAAGGGHRLVLSLEESAAVATVYSVPIRFAPIPAW